MYIDKTALIYHLTHTNKIYFLSRPRRFGKSLLVSTLEAYFSGKKELFEGLAMEQLEKEWTVYPVLHIDFSRTKYTTIEDLQEQLNLYPIKVHHIRQSIQQPAFLSVGRFVEANRLNGLHSSFLLHFSLVVSVALEKVF